VIQVLPLIIIKDILPDDSTDLHAKEREYLLLKNFSKESILSTTITTVGKDKIKTLIIY